MKTGFLIPFLALIFVSSMSSQNAPIPAPATIELPDVALIDQHGQPLHFTTDVVKGRMLVVTTFFTECAAICPVTGQKFAQLSKLLGKRLGRDVVLVSVSVDPENDTPANMREWIEQFHVKRGWTLLSGEKPELDRLLKSLGLYVEAAQRHQSGVIIGSKSAGWVRVSALESAEKWNKVIEELSAGSAGGTGSPAGRR